MAGGNKSPAPRSPASTTAGSKKSSSKKASAASKKKASAPRKATTKKATKKPRSAEPPLLHQLQDVPEFKVLEVGGRGVIEDNENDVLHCTDVNIDDEERKMAISTGRTSMTAAEQDLAYWPNTHVVERMTTKRVLANAGSKLTPPISLPKGKEAEDQVEYLARSFQEFLSSVLPEVAAIARHRETQRRQRDAQRAERENETDGDVEMKEEPTQAVDAKGGESGKSNAEKSKREGANDVASKKILVTMADLDALRQTSRTLPAPFERRIVEAMLTPNSPPQQGATPAQS